MAAPYVMASPTWRSAPPPPAKASRIDSLTTWSVNNQGGLVAPASTFTAGANGVWTKDGAPTPATCAVTYSPPAAPGDAPTVTVATGGC